MRHRFDIQLFAYDKQANKKSSNIVFILIITEAKKSSIPGSDID